MNERGVMLSPLSGTLGATVATDIERIGIDQHLIMVFILLADKCTPNEDIVSFRLYIQGVLKKRQNFCYTDFILQNFKHCHLQSSPLYWRYTVPNVSSIVGMLPGTHFL